MRREIIIDGQNFDDLAGFYDEVERVLTKDLSWHIGRNLDAFNDVLRGGFGIHEYGEPISIKWIHYAKSRRDFGYPATVQYYEEILKRCHTSNVDHLQKKLQNAKNQSGQTLLDRIVEIILDMDDSGHDCTFESVD
jgi:RNAse (barnase) inhibitor barstar